MFIKDEVVDEISWCVARSMGWSDLYDYSRFKSIVKNCVSEKSADSLIQEIKRNKE